MRALPAVTLEAIQAAAGRIKGLAVRTPLVRLNVDDAPAEIWLKLENLQPIGSFKIRGAGNAMASQPRERLARGVYTASAGNMAQGVGWMARQFGVPFAVVVPDHAPATKLDAIRRLGGRIHAVPFDDWWRVIIEHGHPDMDGAFIHPVSDPDVIAGNGTIGLEILEDLPDVDAVVIPFGGGGLSCGIATAMRALKPDTRIYAAEVATAAPLHAALRAGRPVPVSYTPTFVDGIGSRQVLDEMWPHARDLLDDALVAPLESVADAVRRLAERNRIVSEGAGAAAVAAALAGQAGSGRVVCIVSGGNIDAARLAALLERRPA